MRAGNTTSMARDERAELVDLLVMLTHDQWNAPTLCTRWQVRDVVAHIFSYDELSTRGLVGRFLRSGLNPERANAVGVAAYADRSPDELIAFAKNNLQPRGLPARFGGRIALTDGTIHQQDIRRSLGLASPTRRSGSPSLELSRPRRRSMQPSASAG